MERESNLAVKIGLEIIVLAFFMFLVVIATYYARTWFGTETYRKYQTKYMVQTAESWLFDHNAIGTLKYNNGKFTDTLIQYEEDPSKEKYVTGDDIVNFIIKNDTRYEYVIGTGSFESTTIDERDHMGQVKKNPDGTPKTKTTGAYNIKKNHYVFSDTDKMADGSIRILNYNLMNKMWKSGKEGLHILSEEYLLNTCGLKNKLDKKFRVYVEVQNDAEIGYYFLQDKTLE